MQYEMFTAGRQAAPNCRKWERATYSPTAWTSAAIPAVPRPRLAMGIGRDDARVAGGGGAHAAAADRRASRDLAAGAQPAVGRRFGRAWGR